MEFIKPGIKIDFLSKKNYAFILSALLILTGLISIITHGGLNFGIDFAGGTIIQIKFTDPITPLKIKDDLKPLGLNTLLIQDFGNSEGHEFLIRTDISVEQSENISKRIKFILEESYGKGAIEIRRVEMVGPKVGSDLRQKAFMAIFISLLFVSIYISGRFELKWLLSGVMAAGLFGVVFLLRKMGVTNMAILICAAMLVTIALCWTLKLNFALGAIVALIHDVLITIGVFSITNKEFTLPIIAALLTIIGYSLNDTIVVFDRIRENIRAKNEPDLPQTINRSINETLSRTILTSMTTMIVLLSLFIFGGGVIHDFAFAMIIGVMVGTYSSIYIASPTLLINR